MPASNLMTFTFKLSTATSVTLTGTKPDMVGADATITLTSGSETVTYAASMDTELEKDFTITGLSPETTYTVTYSGEVSPSGNVTSVTTLADEPRVATQSQWADLVNRVKAIVSNYSLNELNTGAKWIDGSAIYKKTIATGALPSAAGTATVAHGISNLDKVIKIEGAYTSSSGGYIFDINSPATGADNAAAFRTYVQGANIDVNVGSNRSDFSGYVTLYYTKSS